MTEAGEGVINAFFLTDCPDGWVIADGTNGTPDLRGRFIRGLDDRAVGAGGIDPAGPRTIGGEQMDAFQGHKHMLYWRIYTDASLTGSGARHLLDNVGGAGFNSPDPIGSANTDSGYGTPRTDIETRPRNVALIYCMRKN